MGRIIYLISLAGRSAYNRRGTLSLVILAVIFSTMLLLGIEKVRTQLKENFVQAVSGTDLIVGPKGGDLNLVLFAIFHLGDQPTNISMQSVQKLAHRSDVDWVVPISLGDSHAGYPVVATTKEFYEHYRFRGTEKISFAQGKLPQDLFDITLGSEVAKNLGYSLGQKLFLSHGLNSEADELHHEEANLANHRHAHEHGHEHATVHEQTQEHADTHEHEHEQARIPEHSHGHKEFAFTVTGILHPTGTPVDRSLYVRLEALEAIHIPHRLGSHTLHMQFTKELLKNFDLTPKNVTATLVGLKDKHSILSVKREIDDNKEDPLLAVIPGVVMDKIWDFLGNGEKILLLISSLVTITGLASLAAVILAGLGERRRELAILRSVGARPSDIIILLLSEGFLLVLSGIIIGTICLYGIIALLTPYIANRYGIFLNIDLLSINEWLIIAGISFAGILTSLIPAIRAYHLSLSDGLNVTV